MDKYIADMLRNNIVSLCSSAGCTKPQQKAVELIVRGLFMKGAPLLRQLGDRQTGTAKKEAERFGTHLGNVELPAAVNAVALRKVAAFIGENDVIAYDLTDASKECAEKLEWLAPCFDGSKRKSASGAVMHGVGVADFLLRLRVHDGDKEFLPQVRREIITEIIRSIGNKGIWALDRGNDSKELFRFLNEQLLKFIVRLKKNRMVIRTDTGEELRLDDMAIGRYEVHLRDDHGKIDTDNAYLLVIRDHLPGGHPPIRLLCSRNLRQFKDDVLVTKYLCRWGVENSFKRIKSLYRLESIRVMKYKRFVNLVALIQFVAVISAWLYRNLRELACFLFSQLDGAYRKYLRTESLTRNPHSFGKFLRQVVSHCRRYRKQGGKTMKNKSQTTLWGFGRRKVGVI